MSGSNGQSNGTAAIPAAQGLVGYKKPPVHSQFKPGQSGNPGGSRTAGAFIREHMNALTKHMEDGNMTAEDMAEIATSDPNGNRRIAAQTLLGSMVLGWTKSGQRIGGQDFDRIMDRTEGKPQATVAAQVDGTIRVEFVHVDRIAR